MKINVGLGLLGCLCLETTATFTHEVRIINHTNDVDCLDPPACAALKNVRGSIRNLWECWSGAPRKCWYLARIIIDGSLPRDAMCKTEELEYLMDISGYRPSFLSSGPTVGSVVFSFLEEHDGKCEYWIKSGRHAPGNVDCAVQNITDSSLVPLYASDLQDSRKFIADQQLADFLMSQTDVVVLQGLDGDQCGRSIDSVNFSTLYREVLFYGIIGQPAQTTTPRPTTTTPAPQESIAVEVENLGPVELCEYVVADNTEYGRCQQYCTIAFASTTWALYQRLLKREGTAEEFVEFMLSDHLFCYDSRDPMSISRVASGSSRVPAARRRRLWSSGGPQTYAEWSAAAKSWTPSVCPTDLVPLAGD